MPEYRCPVGDYTAQGVTIRDAAWALATHLIDQHCDPAKDDPQSADQTSAPLNDLGDQISLGDIDADIAAKGRVEVDPGIQRGRER